MGALGTSYWIGALTCAVLLGPAREPEPETDARRVRGMTVSCQGWGLEWASDQFARELDELGELGVNWVAIHPYAWLDRDGHLTWEELDPDDPPEWLARPLREAAARGISLFVKPHLGYWGSPFRWRGEIDYPDPGERARFFEDYERWIVDVARCTRGAAAFAVGCELELLATEADEPHWRRIIARVREATDARLTYAANWDGYTRVPFWDALDAIGVQAYFPLSVSLDPDEAELLAGWAPALAELESLHVRTGKPVVFTELGYDRSLSAAREPWSSRTRGAPRDDRADALQVRLLTVGLRVLERESDWLRGAFLWKWFPGEARRASFLMDTPAMRSVIGDAWARGS